MPRQDDLINPDEEPLEEENPQDSVSEPSSNLWETGKQFASSLGSFAQSIPRQRGEDYYIVLDYNPFVQSAARKSEVVYQNPEFGSTLNNISWTTTALWSIATGNIINLNPEIITLTNTLFHVGPGHARIFEDINRYMDSVMGRGHRLKFGHSIEHLPDIIDEFGLTRGVAGYLLHILQDFNSPDGIPIVPYAWQVKNLIQQYGGVSATIGRSVVQLNAARFLVFVALFAGASMTWRFTSERLLKNKRVTDAVLLAEEAFSHGDVVAAVENYLRALDIERDAELVVKLGDVYALHPTYRLRAFSTYDEVISTLSSNPTRTVELGHAQISLRGWACLNALSAIEQLDGLDESILYPECERIINAAVFSFKKTGDEQLAHLPKFATPHFFSSAINYYLAACALASYPLVDNGRQRALDLLQQSFEALNLVVDYDEEQLRPPVDMLKKIWVQELFFPEEIETEMASYVSL